MHWLTVMWNTAAEKTTVHTSPFIRWESNSVWDKNITPGHKLHLGLLFRGFFYFCTNAA
jgi:hypothetical protein